MASGGVFPFNLYFRYSGDKGLFPCESVSFYLKLLVASDSYIITVSPCTHVILDTSDPTNLLQLALCYDCASVKVEHWCTLFCRCTVYKPATGVMQRNLEYERWICLAAAALQQYCNCDCTAHSSTMRQTSIELVCTLQPFGIHSVTQQPIGLGIVHDDTVIQLRTLSGTHAV